MRMTVFIMLTAVVITKIHTNSSNATGTATIVRY